MAAGARILFAEDDPEQRRLLSALLEMRGFEVLEATDGRQALALALERPPDILVADLDMPGMSGLELARRLRASPAVDGLPIVVVTGSVRTAAGRLTELVDRVLIKPVFSEELLEAIDRLLEPPST